MHRGKVDKAVDTAGSQAWTGGLEWLRTREFWDPGLSLPNQVLTDIITKD